MQELTKELYRRLPYVPFDLTNAMTGRFIAKPAPSRVTLAYVHRTLY